MTLRLLHLADLHLDRAFAGMGCHGELARRRRQGLRDALRRAGEAALQRGCDAVTIGGDLYEHERADLDTGRFIADLVASWAPMRVLVAPGNHDALLPDSLYRRTDWPANLHLFTEASLTPLRLEGGTVWGLAHRGPAWDGDPLDTAPPGGDGPHVALFHGAELGWRPEGKSAHGPFRAARIAELGFAVALCGHYHRRRVDLDARLVYPGSPEPLTFDEEGRRGPVIIEVDDDGAVRHEPLALNAWTAVSTSCDIDGAPSLTAVLDRACERAADALGDRDPERMLLRLDLDGDVAPEIGLDVPTVEATVREALGIALVRARDRTAPALDVATARLDPTARGAFTRDVLAAIEAATTDTERAVLEDALRYGLQALGGIAVGLR